MARQSGFDRRDSGWRDLVWAGVAASLVTLLLVVGVALAWLVGGGPANMPAFTAPEPPTPTPRALSFVRSTPVPSAVPDTDAALSVTEQDTESSLITAAVESTPAQMAISIAGDSTESRTRPSFEASIDAEFLPLLSGSWTTDSDLLVNPGAQAVSERWLVLSPVSSPSFAVEAEIRVTNVLETVCDQSFGIAGGSPASGLVFGGGVIFPCGSKTAEARLTDVTVWEDGYNADAVIANKAFRPGEEWRTYRFEIRGNRLRLLVDGVGVVSSAADPSIAPTALDAEAGLWSQGVALEVRRVAIYPLPR